MTHTKLQKIFISTIKNPVLRNLWKRNLSVANCEFEATKRRQMKTQSDKD